jgi:hypothetical protein
VANDLEAELAKQIVQDDAGKTFRLGVVTSVSGTANNPATIDVDGRTMRFIGNGDAFDTGDTVIYVVEGVTPFVLGALNNGADVGWGRNQRHYIGGQVYNIGISPGSSHTFNLYAGAGIDIPDSGLAVVRVSATIQGTNTQTWRFYTQNQLSCVGPYWEGITRLANATTFKDDATVPFYEDLNAGLWTPQVRVSCGGDGSSGSAITVGVLFWDIVFEGRSSF